MPKYWGKQIFSLERFPEVGQKPKTEEIDANGDGEEICVAEKLN